MSCCIILCYYSNTYHRLYMLLQAHVPGFLHRHHTITEGFFTPPQNLLWDQVEAFEGFPQKVLLHSMLLTEDMQDY